MLASLPNRRQQQPYQPSYSQTVIIPQQQQQQHQLSSLSVNTTPSHIPITTPQPLYSTSSNLFSFGQDQPLFDFQSQYTSSPPQPLMQSENSHHSWLENGQLTPRSTTRAHQRESSLSSLGSAGPSSPYTVNTSNPQVVGDLYHDFHEYHHASSKPLTPAHTPSQEHFLTPHYSSLYHNSNLAYTMSQDTAHNGDAELRPSPEFQNSGRPSVASHESPSTPPSYEEGRQKNAPSYRTSVPKLDRTMTDVYADELYNPHLYITSAAPTSTPNIAVSPQNDVFTQRLQAANNQHLSASNTQTPLKIPSRERSPFRQGSPLAPTGNSFGHQSPNVRFGTATHMREQQKAENDARALQQQLDRTSPGHSTPATISPKDVDLVYHESEEDANTPLFPQQNQSPSYRKQATMSQASEGSENAGQRKYGNMTNPRRESSSGYSNSSMAQNTNNGNSNSNGNGSFTFTPPSAPGNVRVPQQYPFVPQTRRQPSSMSNATEDFPATLTSMESSSSEYAGEPSEIQKPSDATAGSGTYSCTYHNCTLRFDTPAKLQKHKREGHRNSATAIGGSDDSNAAARNSQAGPHKCERVNPSTGRACNVIFSRPYDLTRHEDTIHNARKQKVYCPICTEEKSFSRNDALTRHLRVVHPEVDASKGRRRGNH